MNSIVESFTEISNSTLEQVTEMQARVLEWNRQVAETIVPRFSGIAGTDPFGTKDLAADWLQATFAFQSKALEANRTFAAGLIEAWTPKAEATEAPGKSKG